MIHQQLITCNVQCAICNVQLKIKSKSNTWWVNPPYGFLFLCSGVPVCAPAFKKKDPANFIQKCFSYKWAGKWADTQVRTLRQSSYLCVD